VTPLARYVLQSNVAAQAVVWELTNATPGNKHVDPVARQLLGRCRAVLSPSQTIDQNIRLNHGYKGRILRLPFWIEDKREEQKAESKKQKGHESYLPSPISCLPSPRTASTDFIYLGRRDVEKGLHELVRATAEVSKQFPGVRVLIAGQGSEEPFAAAARELGVAENIRFQFFRTREETMDALANSRCLVLPSYHEGYPLVLLEAAQFSVPFIATSVGSVPELFAGANGCEIVPPRDERALAGAMLRVLGETPEVYAAKRAAVHSLFHRLSSQGAVEAALRRVLGDLNGE
jgi:glycosyltransferase involved in cell wall biosynthesis